MQRIQALFQRHPKTMRWLRALPASLVLLLLMAMPALAAGIEDPFKEALTTGQKVIMATVALAVFMALVALIALRKFGWALGVLALGIVVAVFVSNPVNVLKSGVNLICGSFKSLGCDNQWFNNSGL